MNTDIQKEFDRLILQISQLSYTITQENARLTKGVEGLQLRLLEYTEKAVEELKESNVTPKRWSPIGHAEILPTEVLESANFCWQQIPKRARRVLKHYKIRKPYQLASLTEKKIRSIDNVGNATIEAIHDLCGKYGVLMEDQ